MTPPPFWNFSKNSSLLEMPSFPYLHHKQHHDDHHCDIIVISSMWSISPTRRQPTCFSTPPVQNRPLHRPLLQPLLLPPFSRSLSRRRGEIFLKQNTNTNTCNTHTQTQTHTCKKHTNTNTYMQTNKHKLTQIACLRSQIALWNRTQSCLHCDGLVLWRVGQYQLLLVNPSKSFTSIGQSQSLNCPKHKSVGMKLQQAPSSNNYDVTFRENKQWNKLWQLLIESCFMVTLGPLEGAALASLPSTNIKKIKQKKYILLKRIAREPLEGAIAALASLPNTATASEFRFKPDFAITN